MARVTDDGKGPYKYCQGGWSYCLDHHCSCTDTSSYRVLYLLARGCRNPLRYLAVCWPWHIVAAIGAALVWLCVH